ncbi:MAG: GlsB/YeaQ/YmgE family stress response membrane protein [Armatimonadetes bacterium]|nr:GlsB/YeaQ/YmgE family stress response membrane protein [Armatimonadota bacterium]
MEWVVLLVVAVLLGWIAVAVLGFAVNLLWYLLVGAVVGLIANALVSLFRPAGGPQGFLSTTLAGIAGSFLGAILFGGGFLASILGAIIVVFIWKVMTTRRYAY